jgi:hypothetical protein
MTSQFVAYASLIEATVFQKCEFICPFLSVFLQGGKVEIEAIAIVGEIFETESHI